MTPTVSLLVLATVLSGAMICLIAAGLRRLRRLPKGWSARLFVSRRKASDPDAVKPGLLHLRGVAISQLRPSCAAFINGKRVDVITEGMLIDRGASVEVVCVEGMRVVVREL